MRNWEYDQQRPTTVLSIQTKIFIDDEKLNRIRLDKTLFHFPKSHGSYVDARTGRRTIRGAKAKERVVSSNEKLSSNDSSNDRKLTKVRKCPPRCMYVVQCQIQKTKHQKYHRRQSIVQFCLVSLCIKMIGNRKITCFECFHQIQDLSDLHRNNDFSATKTSSPKKRKTTDSDDE